MIQLFLIFLCFSAVLSDDDFAASSRAFAGDIYSHLVNNDNFLVSPFSAEAVFALAQSGAAGATAEEIRSVLHLPGTKEEAEEVIGGILPTLTSTRITVVSANKIYVDNDLPIKEDFQKVATNVYQADFQNVEFSQSGAATLINEWVEEKTNNKIKDLFSEDDFSASTRIVLVNALYFKANWSKPFDTYDTKKAAFYTSEDTTVDCDFMFYEYDLQQFNYFESDELDAQVLELPFQGGQASMVFVLPRKKEGIALLEKNVKAALDSSRFQKVYVKLQIPKFKIETTIDMDQVLKEMGIQKAFNAGEADFSGIAGGKGDLYLTKAVQKTYIDVNEHGVEAAAATGTGGEESEHSPSATFKADHPFLFYIKFNDIILFEGRVVLPKY